MYMHDSHTQCPKPLCTIMVSATMLHVNSYSLYTVHVHISIIMQSHSSYMTPLCSMQLSLFKGNACISYNSFVAKRLHTCISSSEWSAQWTPLVNASCTCIWCDLSFLSYQTSVCHNAADLVSSGTHSAY